MMKENLLDIYSASFRDNWTLPALTDYGSGRTRTYADFAETIARAHVLYEMLGLKRGDKVALIGKNSSRWVEVFMSLITYGATIVPILHEFNPQDAQHIVVHSDARLLFVSATIGETIPSRPRSRKPFTDVPAYSGNAIPTGSDAGMSCIRM